MGLFKINKEHGGDMQKLFSLEEKRAYHIADIIDEILQKEAETNDPNRTDGDLIADIFEALSQNCETVEEVAYHSMFVGGYLEIMRRTAEVKEMASKLFGGLLQDGD